MTSSGAKKTKKKTDPLKRLRKLVASGELSEQVLLEFEKINKRLKSANRRVKQLEAAKDSQDSLSERLADVENKLKDVELIQNQMTNTIRKRLPR